MNTLGSERLTTTPQRFVEYYGITPRFFVSRCLLPSLLAVRPISCFYHGVLVERREVPAWRARLRALRTVFAMVDAHEIEEKHIKIPLGTLGPAQLATIIDAFQETDWRWMTTEFLAKCVKCSLEAANSVLLFYHGKLVDSYETRDSKTQLESAEIGLRIWKVYPKESDNINFTTYRDIALLVAEPRRNKVRTVELIRDTQLVHMR